MSYKRFFKKCEEFCICGVIGNAGAIDMDGALDNNTIYHIVIKGTGRLGTPFDSNIIEMSANKNNFIDEKHLLGKERIYKAYSDFHIFGFNPLKPDQDWDGKLVKKSFFGDSKSYLICFDGHPIVNSFEMKRMDYAKLTEKEYKLELNGGLLGMFTKNYGFNYEN